MNRRNIALIGMPGCGKSTIGVLLAKAMNYQFVDTDLIIQARERKTLQDIIEESGNTKFREIEDSVIAELIYDGHIIATGGSVIYGEKGMAHLKEISTIVYIKLECDEIIRRINNIKTRGITMRKGETLESLYKERTPLYEKYADLVVGCDGRNIEECVEEIINAIEEEIS